ncbi:MAG TPA: hypothetical protein VI893_11025, partial [Thermoplasmata archaeon]|nr:hypothetical protein [Thermoplasmata archaeon]
MSEDGAIRRGRPQNELVSSGLADLDVLMGDGIPQGYAVLVVVPAGELALRLTESFILGGLTGGEGLILTLSTLSTQEFASRTARYNIDLAALGDRARIIDWYSWRRERFTGIRDEGQTTKISKDLVNVEVAVTRAKRKLMKATEHRRAVFDFLGPALADYERQEALDITRSIIAKMRADKITSFWLLAGERVHEKELAGLLDLFDGVVMVQGKGDEFALQILNLRARPFSRERHSLKMGMDGSLVVGLVPMSRSESVESQSAAAAPPGGDEGHGFSFSVKATGRPPGGSVEPTPSRHEPPKAETKAKGTTPTEEIRPRRVVERDTSEETPESQEAPEAAIPQSVPAQPPRSPAAAAALARHPPPRVVRSVPPIPPPISRPSRPAAPRKSRIPAATSAVALVILLLLGVLLYFMPLGQRHDISVDGGFDDWSPFVILKDDDGPRRPGGVELKEYGLHRDNGRLCAYARTSAPLAAGVGGRIIILIDEDGRPGTGYSSRLLDADASMTVIGNQDKFTGTFSEFNEQGNERLNWSRWKPGPGFAVADAGDGRVESCLESDPTAAGA